MAHLHSARGHRVPQTTELVELLAVGIARIGVADVVVQRMTVVSDLHLATAARGCAQQRCGRTGSRLYRGWGCDRRPDAKASARAGRRCPAVSREQIHRSALAVGED